MLQTNDPKEAMEAIIDHLGLFATLELIEVICEEKADHIRENWQDLNQAGNWLKAASALNEFKMKNQILSV